MLRILALAAAFLFVPSTGAAQAPKPQGKPKPPPARAEVRKALSEMVELPDDYVTDAHKLSDVLTFVSERLEEKGKSVTFLLDRVAYRSVDPEAEREDETKLRFSYRNAPVRVILEDCVRQMATPSVLVLKKDRVEIVPESFAHNDRLLDQSIFVDFRDAPLKDAIEELAEVAGLTVDVDPRCVVAHRTVSLAAESRMTVRAILMTWADFYDLTLVVAERRVVVMPRADYLRKLREEAAKLKGGCGSWSLTRLKARLKPALQPTPRSFSAPRTSSREWRRDRG